MTFRFIDVTIAICALSPSVGFLMCFDHSGKSWMAHGSLCRKRESASLFASISFFLSSMIVGFITRILRHF
jgi:hypothetical protein